MEDAGTSRTLGPTVPPENPPRVVVQANIRIKENCHFLIELVGCRGEYRDVQTRLEDRSFSFDRVFDGEATQQSVFASVRPLVESVINGYNATVMAYGSTGSGKTHTIMGVGGLEAAMAAGLALDDGAAGEGEEDEAGNEAEKQRPRFEEGARGCRGSDGGRRWVGGRVAHRPKRRRAILRASATG